MFISVEGIDNIGKSTVCNCIKDLLEKRNQTVVLVNDPPNVEPWRTWKETMTSCEEIEYAARATLFFAARLDAVARIIKPALKRKEVVITDRYIDSWLAYHVSKFEEFMPKEQSFQLLLGLHRMFLSAGLMLEPDETFLLTVNDTRVLAQRGMDKPSSVFDAIQERIQANYIWLAERFGKSRIRIINVSGKTATAISEEICREIPSCSTKTDASS
jgi:dTMP kinase